MNFEFPQLLGLAFLLIPLAWLMYRGERRIRLAARLFDSRPPVQAGLILRLGLAAVVTMSLLAVAAQPYLTASQTGRFLFLVDVSRSMQARNTCTQPTFLDRSKRIIRSVLQAVPEAHFGIIAFDRLAFPVTHITQDHDYLREVVEHGLHIGMTFEATKTELANALRVTAAKKRDLPSMYDGVSRVVLLSDGHIEGDYRRRLRQPLADLQQAGMPVLAVGIGNRERTRIMKVEEGACIEVPVVLEGQPVTVPLRDDVLRFIANESGGEYLAEGEVDKLTGLLRAALSEHAGNGKAAESDYRRDISPVFLLLATLSLAGLLWLYARPPCRA